MKNIKKIACVVALSVCLGASGPIAPVLALENVTATKDETNANLFTMEEIQKLAVSQNQASKVMSLNLKILEENRMITGNERRDVDSNLSNVGGSAGNNNSIAAIRQSIADLEVALAAKPGDAMIKSQLVIMRGQLAQAEAGLESAQASAQNSIDSVVAAREKLDDALIGIEDSQDDLKKSQKDWESEIQLVSGLLVINAVEVQNNIDLLEKQHGLAVRMQELEKVKLDLGLSIDNENVAKTISATEASNQLIQAKAGLTSIKRQINDLIGRPLNATLEIVPVALPTLIDYAPVFSERLVDKITDKNYKLKTLERDLTNIANQSQKGLASEELGIIDRNKDLKQMDITTQKTTIANDVKNKLEQINKTADNYRTTKLTYDKEAKNLAFAKQKLDLGMMSPIEYQSAEMTMLGAETNRAKAGYDHFLAWQEYRAMEQGISLSTYSQYKGM